jgi:hypothetical protein
MLRLNPALLALSLAGAALAAPAGVDFQREIRPILSENCFQCHGPDPATRMAGLRLDTREGAFAARPSGKVIVPGEPKASLLYQRVFHEKEALRMPPAFARKNLTSQQKDVLRRWIEQGAPWKEHWSFQAPSRPALPRVAARGWTRNPIDTFILAKLEAARLQPAPEADRRRLIRRLSFDITGLPPEPSEVEAFLADKSSDAYEKLVDRLLASPHYGEHRARYWLDAARYADTHGIHIDNYREMWPYRDWVIGAFNRNLSFDKFTVEQLAGDLLPNHTTEQQVATGFHRCNMTTNEGGSIPEEVAVAYAKDRVETTGAVWLGLTIGCASCHDHKFDPIAQKEFYQFAAFFRNTTQNPMDGNIPDTPPVIVIPGEQDAPRWEQLRSEAMAARSRAAARREAAKPAFEAWLEEKNFDKANPLDPGSEMLAITSVPEKLPQDVTAGEGPDETTRALHFTSKSTYAPPSAPVLEAGKPFSIAAWVYLPGGDNGITVANQTTAKRDEKKDDDDEAGGAATGWSITISGRVPAIKLTAGKSSITVRGSNVERVKPKSWTHLTFTYDGSRGQNGLSLYVNGKAVTNVNDGGGNVELKGDFKNPAPLKLGGGAVAEFRIFNRELRQEEAQILASWSSIQAAAAKAPGDLSKAERESLLNYYVNRSDAEYRKIAAGQAAIEFERRTIRRRAAITHVMQEKAGSMPKANILFRGQYDQLRDEVAPASPSVLPPMAASMPRNRLGLAQWLIDPSNPLTARVTVNRFWQEIFGTGLVKTAEDFGSQGEPPSHPELLDWLAVEFRESGWDVKKLVRMMVTSATYRQSAKVSEEKLKADPENRLLSRGPRFRIDGEMVRDLALASSGLLVPTIGGPSVKPYQPEGVWETVAMKGSNTRFYKQDHDEKLYRRSMYTFWKRAAPPASMEIFNAPTRENCTVRRERTDTPLQALVTMNDTQFVEASRNLAEHAIRGAASDADQRLDFMSMRVLARPFQARERQVAKGALKDFLSYYDSHPEQAAKLIKVGESKHDTSLPAAELAAWTMLASDILNLDEALNK